jgi:hypothetical protein
LVVGRFKIGAIAAIATIALLLLIGRVKSHLQFTVPSGLKGKRLMTGMTKLEANSKILGRNVVYWHAGRVLSCSRRIWPFRGFECMYGPLSHLPLPKTTIS